MKLIGKRSVASVLRKALTGLWWTGIVMAGLLVVLAVVFLVFGLPKGMESPRFTLDANFLQVEFNAVTIHHPKTLLLAFLPFGAAMIGLGMGILFQVRKIFATLAAGNPFSLENANRMKKIGLLIFGCVAVELVTGTVMGLLIMENVIVPGVRFSVKGGLDLGGIFFGLVMLILGEIFRQGALLQQEQDLTI